MEHINSILGGGVGFALLVFGGKLAVSRMLKSRDEIAAEKLKNAVRDAVTETKVNILYDLRKEDYQRLNDKIDGKFEK